MGLCPPNAQVCAHGVCLNLYSFILPCGLFDNRIPSCSCWESTGLIGSQKLLFLASSLGFWDTKGLRVARKSVKMAQHHASHEAIPTLSSNLSGRLLS